MAKLMTVNLFNGRADPGHFAEVLDRVEPDILVAQELDPDCAAEIERRFLWHHLRPTHDYLGWAIATRDSGTEIDPNPAPWRRGGSAVTNVDGSRAHVACVHMVDPMHWPPTRTLAFRRQQLRALRRWADALPGEAPLLIAGDMNAGPNWPLYRRLSAEWDDLVVDAARSSGIRPERTWGIPNGRRFLRIDHVLGRWARGKSFEVIPVRGTDHAAVVVDFEITRAG
jgi:endonuclease/exonuclease/phosphatase family metal-dependent hydrolase